MPGSKTKNESKAAMQGSATNRLTLQDIADAAGVSKSTVSLVVQNSPLVKEKTRDKVRLVMEKLGYVYNRHAASLRSRASDIIGVVIPDLTNPFFAEFVVGLERALGDSGYIIMMTNTEDQLSRQQRVLASLLEHHAAGLVICPAEGTSTDNLATVRQHGIPVVVAMRQIEDEAQPYSFVGADGIAGAREATEYLIGKGHQHIAFIGGQPENPTTLERRKGYLQALERHDLSHMVCYYDGFPTRQTGREAMSALCNMASPPTAAVCYNDMVAFGALSGLGEQGIRAGKQFSVIGFDGVASAAHANPPLTTMSIDPEGLGEASAKMLLQCIANPARPATHYISRPVLLRRTSTI